MRPHDLVLDGPHQPLIHAVLSGDGPLRADGSTNFQNLRVGQLGIAIGGAFQTRGSPFGNFVCNVVVIGSKEEMILIDASPIVASVENLLAIWNWTDQHLPHQPMRERQLSIPDLTVSSGVDRCCPLVAASAIVKCGRDFVYLGPKATIEVFRDHLKPPLSAPLGAYSLPG